MKGLLLFKNVTAVGLSLTCVVSIFVLLVGTLAVAEMTSANFIIKEDAFVAGGNTSSSSNYSMEDTIGQVAGSGESESPQYLLWSGLWYGWLSLFVPGLQTWAMLVLVVILTLSTRKHLKIRRSREIISDKTL